MLRRLLAVLALLAVAGCAFKPAPKCDASGTLNLRIVAQDYHVKTSELIFIHYWNQQRPDGILDKNGYKEPLYCRQQGYGRSPIEVAGIGLEVPLADGRKMRLEVKSEHLEQPGWRPFSSSEITSVRLRSEQDQAALNNAIAVFKLRDGTVSETKALCFETSDGRDIDRASCRIVIPLETGNSLTAYSTMTRAKSGRDRTDDLIRALARVETLEAESKKAFAGEGWP
jgi:hypothetical protein